MRGISWVAQDVLASQEGLCSIEYGMVSESMQLVAIFRRIFIKSGKRAVALSRLLSARINAAFAGQIFFEISYRGTLTKICRETPNFIKIGQKYKSTT
jgi:hypothetical protein